FYANSATCDRTGLRLATEPACALASEKSMWYNFPVAWPDESRETKETMMPWRDLKILRLNCELRIWRHIQLWHK
ncbi:MAG: hypothetical protein RSD95_15445, partial [Clostridia bacterium]